MSMHFFDSEVVIECDGCGDTALSRDVDGEWGTVFVSTLPRFDFCSCSCLWAWNGHVVWGDDFGDRPGHVRDQEMPF